jgi:peptidoglycan hydrolase-like protein with peptidoglycan-binding domain
MGNRGNLIVLFAVIISLAFTASIHADENRPADLQYGWGPDNLRVVQEKLREDGLYFGEIDGAYGSELAAALGRYQIRNGLQITGQLDAETAKALGVKPAVTFPSPHSQTRTSETWERLRKRDKEFPGKTVWRAPSAGAKETGIPPQSTPAATAPAASETGGTTAAPAPTSPVAQVAKSSPQKSPVPGGQASSENEESASAPPATAVVSPAPDLSTERLRDYVGAFVLAGLDPQVGAEAAFFADRVQYYNEGVKDREKIRADLKRYDSRWPGRKFWLAGKITVEPQRDKHVRVTFPLRYELRNGGKHSSGKINKTLVLEPAGDDLKIVAVSERKAK